MKEKFENLEKAARAHNESTGDFGPLNCLLNARTNADDTFSHNELHPDYWRVATGSIADTEQSPAIIAWFKSNGHLI